MVGDTIATREEYIEMWRNEKPLILADDSNDKHALYYLAWVSVQMLCIGIALELMDHKCEEVTFDKAYFPNDR
ncbi:hypothetical protein DPMN_108991 [Dreissena polymorpha]|uniref:Uncharacterized protein n=1 Tax=Dreissena polymorpha TaxID=45954 RepID=A0A9D4QLJ7_DREPO|nr:hypothetical protein DPMN_108991 [Dreissena polymorpha]